jgi:hypothetical protein
MLSFNRANVALLGLLLACVAADSGLAKPKAGDPPATTRRAGATPPAFCGRWSYGSVSPTTYWDADTGRFAGNARGAAGILEFDDAGHYTEYVYLEMRTYHVTSKVWTVHSGDVAFDGDRMTLAPTQGHYKSWINDKPKTDRDMTADERAKLVKTYRWTMTRDDAGREVLTIPFEDGSKFEYRRAERE